MVQRGSTTGRKKLEKRTCYRSGPCQRRESGCGAQPFFLALQYPLTASQDSFIPWHYREHDPDERMLLVLYTAEITERNPAARIMDRTVKNLT